MKLKGRAIGGGTAAFGAAEGALGKPSWRKKKEAIRHRLGKRGRNYSWVKPGICKYENAPGLGGVEGGEKISRHFIRSNRRGFFVRIGKEEDGPMGDSESALEGLRCERSITLKTEDWLWVVQRTVRS